MKKFCESSTRPAKTPNSNQRGSSLKASNKSCIVKPLKRTSEHLTQEDSEEGAHTNNNANIERTDKSQVNIGFRQTAASTNPYRGIKQHCKRIRDMLNSSTLEGLDIDNKYKQKIIRKTQITSNNIFSEKEFAELISREDELARNYPPVYKMTSQPVQVKMHPLAATASPPPPLTESMVQTPTHSEQKELTVRQELKSYMDWADGVVLPIKKNQNGCYKKFQIRGIDKENIKLQPSPIPPPCFEQDRAAEEEQKKRNMEKAVQRKLEKQLSEYAKKVENRLTRGKRYNLNSRSQQDILRIEGLYESKVLKHSMKLFEKLGRGCPFAVRFVEDNKTRECQEDSQEIDVEDKPHKERGVRKSRGHLDQKGAGCRNVESYCKRVREERKRLIEKLFV